MWGSTSRHVYKERGGEGREVGEWRGFKRAGENMECRAGEVEESCIQK